MSTSADPLDTFDESALRNFQEYLRIPSVHPNINYDECVAFLKKQAESLGLPIRIYCIVTGKPIVVITWVGKEPNLPSIMLNSHMDVVPAYEDKWTHKPFSADMDSAGNIYARGTQDMKSVGIQYLEAVRKLKSKKVTLRRTVHITFLPDEETGEAGGMKHYVASSHFKDLNVGVVFDEGMPNPTEEFLLFNGERAGWKLHIHCPGQPGHGSLLHDNTAGERVLFMLTKMMIFREQEKQKLRNNPDLTLGDVITLNLTQISGGVQSNVLPPEFVIVFDCRIPVTVNHDEWEATLNQWCEEAGGGTRIEYEHKHDATPVTQLDDSNPYWKAFEKSVEELQLKVSTRIFPADTDSRHIRVIGIPAFGFSPMNNTPVLLHDHNEYLNITVFLKGIDIYCKLITDLANLEGDKVRSGRCR
ncbi:hypothetical protein Trydic_g18028 [Trypoxylus dichotomus]